MFDFKVCNYFLFKVLNHQEELKKLLVGTDFFVGQPNYLYVTLFADINSAQNFEYDNLYINYFVKLPLGWECNNSGSLSGVTQTSYKNSQGIAHFCHLFEINFFLNLQSFEGNFAFKINNKLLMLL